jgi:hypothetical protein
MSGHPEGKIKKCPHCSRTFVCRNEDILNCDCAAVRLTLEIRGRIAELYEDCLCVDCLKHFVSMEGTKVRV